MTKAQLLKKIAEETGIRPTIIRHVLDTTAEVIADTVNNGEQVTWPDLGTFSVFDTKARKAVNIHTGKLFEIKASKRLRFKPDGGLTKRLNSEDKP